MNMWVTICLPRVVTVTLKGRQVEMPTVTRPQESASQYLVVFILK